MAAFRKDAKAVKAQWAGKRGGSQGTGDSRAEDILVRKDLTKMMRHGGLRFGDIAWRSVAREGWRPTVKACSKRERIYGQKAGEEQTVKLLLV